MICLGSCTSDNWQIVTQDSGVDGLDILSIAFTDSKHGWALTSAQLLETNDGGASWTARLEHDGLAKTFDSFAFVSPETGVIVGTRQRGERSGPLILRTGDGGKSWQEIPVNITLPPSPEEISRLNGVSFCTAQVGWAVGAGLILRTTDEGRTWTIQRDGNKGEVLFGVSCDGPDRAWAVGQDGLILHTEDGGTIWHRQESGTQATLLRVRSFGDNKWIVGVNGTLLHLQDGGRKWEQQHLGITEGLADISFSGVQGWIVGSEGLILHTSDGGRTWQQQKSPTKNSLVSLFLLDGKQPWAGGGNRTLLRLIN
jgi:photosystem II stability/assembly factor-like uncharacterized protein